MGLDSDELEDMAVPDYGLEKSRRLGDFTADIAISGMRAEIRWTKPDGKPQKSVPAAVKDLPELEDLKVCVITGKPELRRLIYDRSVRPPEGYVDKPVDEKRLLLNVRKVLEVIHQDA